LNIPKTEQSGKRETPKKGRGVLEKGLGGENISMDGTV